MDDAEIIEKAYNILEERITSGNMTPEMIGWLLKMSGLRWKI